MAGFTFSTGARVDADPRLPSHKQVSRTRRHPDPLAGIWESEIVPMLQAEPGLRPITILGEMLRRHPGFPPDVASVDQDGLSPESAGGRA